MASREEKAHTRSWTRAREATGLSLPARGHRSSQSAAPVEAAATLTHRRGVAPRVVLVIASVAVFMAFLDDSVVAIAFPNMLASFRDATFAQLSWVFNAYNIAFAAFLIPAGLLADLLGRRRFFGIGVVLFTAASALCAAAPSLWVLIGARALQGVGAAVLVPASLALVLEAHAPRERARAVAAWAATAAVAAGFGPSIGGVLVNVYDWRLVFLVNVPIGLIVRYLSTRELVESRAPGRRELPDIAGAVLLAASISALTLAIAQGPVWGWASAGVLVAALVAVLGGALFVRRCRVQPVPVLDRSLLATPRFGVTAIVTALGAAGFFALGVANVVYLIEVWRYSPLTAGLALTPAPFVAAPTALVAGRVAARWDSRKLVSVGAVILVLGASTLVARMGFARDYLGAYLPAAILLAVGIGIAFPLVSDAAVSNAPGSRFAGASALSTAIRLVGGALGVAVLAALVGRRGETLTLAPFRDAWAFAGGCFAVVALLALRLPRSSALAVEEVLSEPAQTRPPSPRPRRTQRRRRAAEPEVAPQGPADMLGSVAMFSSLSPELLRSLAASTRNVHVHSGEWLFRQGDHADALYVVQSGRLEVFLEREGGARERIRELGVGSAVGELGLLSREPRSASVRCRRDAELVCLAREDLERLMDSTPRFAASVSSALASALQRSVSIDSEPAGGARTVAFVPLAADGASAHAARSVLARLIDELGSLARVAHVDAAMVSELHADAPHGVALARTLDRVERDHELVLVSVGAEDGEEWARACVEQADRVLAVVCEPPVDVARLPDGLGGCDAVLLADPRAPAAQGLLDSLSPRATHRVAGATFEADVARLARRLASRSVGLVLSGGGARALAHIGAIEELLGAGIVIDRVGGTSMGAYIGALLAKGMDAAQIDACCYEEWVRRRPLADYGVPRHALLRGARLRAMLERVLGELIEELPCSYYCTAVDAVANELVVYRRGELARALAASMAVPGVLPPLVRDGRLLFDGAVFDGLPVASMAADGEGPVIACDVTKRALRETAPGEAPRVPSLIDTLANLAFLATSDTGAQAQSHADLVIVPEPESVGALEFHMIDSMRDAGRRAAVEALEHAPAALFG